MSYVYYLFKVSQWFKETLKKDFEECGEVLEAEICKEKGTGRSRGIGGLRCRSGSLW